MKQFRSKSSKKREKFRYIAIVLAAIVIFTTTYSLILPAITMETVEAETTPGISLHEEGDKAESAKSSEEQSNNAKDKPVDVSKEETSTGDTAASEKETPNEDVKETSAPETTAPAQEAETKQPETKAETETKAPEKETGVKDPEKTEAETKASEQETKKEKETKEETTRAEDESPAMTFEAEIKRAGTEVKADGLTEAEAAEVSSNYNTPIEDVVIKVTAEAKEGTFQAGTTMKVKEVSNDQAVVDKATDKVDGEVRKLQAVDISFYNKEGKEIEPAKDIKITITSNTIKEEKQETGEDPVIVHIPDRGAAEIINPIDENTLPLAERPTDEEVMFENNQFSVYVIIYTEAFEYEINGITADGKSYKMTIKGDEAAQIPVGSVLKVDELKPGSQEYDNYLKAAMDEMGIADEEEVLSAQFFDIEITKDGKKIEPKAPVSVVVEYQNALDLEGAEDLNVVHFAESSTEVIDTVSVKEDLTAMAWQQDAFSVTGTIITGNPNNGSQYMVLVKQGTDYYLVNNDGSLTQVPTKTEGGQTKVDVDDPMLWTYTGTNLYHNSIQVDFNSGQLASDYYYRYIDPDDTDTASPSQKPDTVNDGLTEDTKDTTDLVDNKENAFDWTTWRWKEYNYKTVSRNSGARKRQTDSALRYVNNHLESTVHPGNYIGVQDGHLVGMQTEANAAEIIFALPNQDLQSHSYKKNSVNHIDISIVGTAGVDVPLAYGKYYDKDKNEILNVTDAKSLHLEQDHVGITTDDMKKARIQAFIQTTNGKKELDDAFVITGYSANETTAYSTDQVRIEGVFKVAYDPAHPDSTDWQNRLSHRVYYTVTAVKPITFDLVDPDVGQLYDADGNKLTITVDVAFSASFDYWDPRNECPPLQGNQDWKNGDIPNHDMSGMDFVLGGNPDDINSQVLAIEITKVIVDENGNRIQPNTPVTNKFNIYKDTKNGFTISSADVVKDLGKEAGKYNVDDYTYLHPKTITIGGNASESTEEKVVNTGGIGMVYDYDVDAGMYLIEEDKSTIPDTITDKSGQTWNYAKTYIETEYAWRDHENDTKGNHKSGDYKDKTSDSYKSIPEVLGSYHSYDGKQNLRNGFLEFIVYNVYESPKVDVPVIKKWPAFDDPTYDWEAEFQLQWAPLNDAGELAGNFKDVAGRETIKITKADMADITPALIQHYLTDKTKLNDTDLAKIEKVAFKDLPKFTTDTSGNAVRIQYSLEELSYKVKEDSTALYTWDKQHGYNDSDPEHHFQAFYPHDAGEAVAEGADAEVANAANTNYYVEVTNAQKNVRASDYVQIGLKKKWDESKFPGAAENEEAYATFELRRYVHTEYRDLSKLSADDYSAADITVQVVNEAGTVMDEIKVKPNTSLYLGGVFAPRSGDQTITFTNQDGSATPATVTVTATGSNTSKQTVRATSAIRLTKDTTFKLTTGADALAGGAYGARIFDTAGGGTVPILDESFSKTITLNKENGWNWQSAKEELLQSETSEGDNDQNENVTIYEYYLVEKSSNPTGFAQFFLADEEDPEKKTEIKIGDIDNRIESGGKDGKVNVIAYNTESNNLTVEKEWRGVPDTTGYPEISFTLYQGVLAGDGTVSVNGSDSWVYVNENGESYKNIKLGNGVWSWTCPETLPESYTGSDSRYAGQKVGYYVKEDSQSGGSGNSKWQFYYYFNSNGKQTNAYNQPGGAGISGESLIENHGGTITIVNQMGRYLQMDIKKQFFMLGEAGSWGNVTATTDVGTNTVLGFKVIRSIQTSDGKFLDENGNVSDTRVWMDYGDELLVGYDANGNAITKNGGANDFFLESGGGDWHFRIRDEQGGANDRQRDKVGLPAYGYYVKDGKSVAVSYAYSYRETGVYKDLDRTPYENWQWFSTMTPDRYVDANGQHSGEFGIKFHGQDGERIANFQASNLQVTKNWVGETDVQEVYVEIWRTKADGTEENFTEVIADDVRDNKNWQNYLADVSEIDTTHNCLILKHKEDGTWTTSSVIVNRALLATVSETTDAYQEYRYYIKEIGFMDKEGNQHFGADAEAKLSKYKPTYSKWVDERYIVTGQDAKGNAIKLGKTGENKLKVTNKDGESTSYTVTKKFAGNQYPTDGSTQVVVELQQRYQNGETWVGWQAAESADPISVTLPRPKPTTKPTTGTFKEYTDAAWAEVTDAQWYATADAWTYTWTGLDVEKVLSESEGVQTKAQLYYRAVETSTPGWFNSVTNAEDGHAAIDDEKQDAAGIASESNTITNNAAEYTLNISKKWIKNGTELIEEQWPADLSVTYEVYQNYHLVNANTSATEQDKYNQLPEADKANIVHINPDYKLGTAFKSVKMVNTDTSAINYNAKASGTLTSTAKTAVVTGLPTYTFITATEDDVTEAAKVGVTLVKGQTYLVAFSYSVKETSVKKGEAVYYQTDFTADGTKDDQDTTGRMFAAVLENELTDLVVEKEWQKDGTKVNTWPEGAEILYKVDRLATYKNQVVEETAVFTATSSTGALKAIGEKYTVEYLPTAGLWTCDTKHADASAGLEAGKAYPVTYTYKVTELSTSNAPTANSNYTYGEISDTAEEITDEADAHKGKLGATLVNDYTQLNVHKKWTKNGESTTWPDGYTVTYQVYQDAYVMSNGNVASIPISSKPYGSAGTLESVTEVDTYDLLPLYGTYTGTEADGTLNGKTVPVKYGYHVQETGVSATGSVKYECDTEAVYNPEAGKVGDTEYTNLATITNDLQDIQVKKAWTKNGEPYTETDGWMPGAQVYFNVEKVTVVNGIEVESKPVYSSYAENKVLDSAADIETVANLAALPTEGVTWTAPTDLEADSDLAKAGIEAGKTYAATYKYVVREDTDHSKVDPANGYKFTYPIEATYDEATSTYTITNDFTEISVKKKFVGGSNTSATVELYQSLVAPDGSTSPETFNITVRVPDDAHWKYSDNHPATAADANNGQIIVEVKKGDELVDTLTLDSRNNWSDMSIDLPKDGSEYSVVVKQTDGTVIQTATVASNNATGIKDDTTVDLNGVLKVNYINVDVTVVNAPSDFSLTAKLAGQDNATLNSSKTTHTWSNVPSYLLPELFSFEGTNADKYYISATNGTVDKANKQVTGINSSTLITLTYPMKITVKVDSWTGDSNNTGKINVPIIDTDTNTTVQTLELTKTKEWEAISNELDPTHHYSIGTISKTDPITSVDVKDGSQSTSLTGGDKNVLLKATAEESGPAIKIVLNDPVMKDFFIENKLLKFSDTNDQDGKEVAKFPGVSDGQVHQQKYPHGGTWIFSGTYLEPGALYGIKMTGGCIQYASGYDATNQYNNMLIYFYAPTAGTKTITFTFPTSSAQSHSQNFLGVNGNKTNKFASVIVDNRHFVTAPLFANVLDQGHLTINPGTTTTQNKYERAAEDTSTKLNETGQTPPSDLTKVEGAHSATLNGTPNSPANDNETKAWYTEWNYLPTVDKDGNHIYYYVVETSASSDGATSMTADYRVTQANYAYDNGQIVQIKHVDIVNTPGEPEKITVSAHKKWQQADSTETNVDPKHFMVEFTLYSDEACKQVVGTETITGNGTATWPNLASQTYYVKETKVSYVTTENGQQKITELWPNGSASDNPYLVSIDSGTLIFTNKLPTTEVRAEKKWVNAAPKDDGTENNAAPAGAKVTFTLVKDGVETATTVELDGSADTAENKPTGEYESWKALFANLPKYNNDGTEIVYTVKETGKWNNYTPDHETVNAGGTITNKPDKGDLKIVKTVQVDGVEQNKLTDRDYYVTISTVIDGITYYVTNNKGTLSKTAPTGEDRLKLNAGTDGLEIKDLPVGSYTVTEDSTDAAVAGYTLANTSNGSVWEVKPTVVTGATPAEANLINNYTQDKTSFRVIKEWKDYDPGDPITTSVKLKLHRAIDGVEDITYDGPKITLPDDSDAGESWQKTWEDLVKYGKITPEATGENETPSTVEGDFIYYVTEESVSDKDNSKIKKKEFDVTNEGKGATIVDATAYDPATQTVTNKKNSISLTVEKTWDNLPSQVTAYTYEITFKIQQYDETARMWKDFDGDDEGTDVDTATLKYEKTADQTTGTYTDNVIGNLPAGKQYRAVETGYKITIGDSLPVEKTDLNINGSSETNADPEGWKSELTNKWEDILIEISGIKTWVDGRSEHADPKLILKRRLKGQEPEAAWEIMLADSWDPITFSPSTSKDGTGEEKVNLQPLWKTEDGKRVYTYPNLPKYDAAYHEYEYLVQEDTTDSNLANYKSEEAPNDTPYGKDFTNTELTKLAVRKKWFPGASEKPEITYVLEKKVGADGDWKQVGDLRTLTQTDNAKEKYDPDAKTGQEFDQSKALIWGEEITDLPMYELVTTGEGEAAVTTKEQITYRIVEKQIKNGSGVFEDIVYAPDGGNEQYINGRLVVTNSKNESNEWIVTNPEPQPLDPYVVNEVSNTEYYTSMTIDNNQEFVTLSGKKTWITKLTGNDLPNLTIELYKQYPNGTTQKVDTVQEANSDNQYYFQWMKTEATDTTAAVWSYAITRMPKKDTGGTIAKYFVKEVVTGNNAGIFRSDFETSDGEVDASGNISNANFTNTELTTVSVTKKWKLNGQEIDNPDSIDSVKLHLHQLGEEDLDLGEYVLEKVEKAEETGKYEWKINNATQLDKLSKLPKYYISGTQLMEYKYYFEELPENQQEWTNQIGIWNVSYSSTGNNPSPIATSAAVEGGGTVNIENSKYTVALPSTGGEGTGGFMRLGLSLMITALCAFGLKMLLFRRREEQ